MLTLILVGAPHEWDFQNGNLVEIDFDINS